MTRFVDQEINKIRSLVGEKGQVFGAVSGEVDSTVAAILMHKAIGDRFHTVLVNNGVMRLNKCKQVQKTLIEHLEINLIVADASQQLLDGPKGIRILNRSKSSLVVSLLMSLRRKLGRSKMLLRTRKRLARSNDSCRAHCTLT
jgi:GMP synthase PP-ATPase subunit